jgi:hypothetical protein
MAPDPALIARLDELIALFNRKGLDIPDGLFDRDAQFVLNGAAFETLLGRPPDDPLVRMITRGPAGYRFVLKAAQNALPDATIERGEVTIAEGGGSREIACQVWLSGTLRGTSDAFDAVVSVTGLLGDRGQVVVGGASMAPAFLERLREARLRQA